jgi:hypothetical protein
MDDFITLPAVTGKRGWDSSNSLVLHATPAALSIPPVKLSKLNKLLSNGYTPGIMEELERASLGVRCYSAETEKKNNIASVPWEDHCKQFGVEPYPLTAGPFASFMLLCKKSGLSRETIKSSYAAALKRVSNIRTNGKTFASVEDEKKILRVSLQHCHCQSIFYFHFLFWFRPLLITLRMLIPVSGLPDRFTLMIWNVLSR